MRTVMVGAILAMGLLSGCATTETKNPKWQLVSIDAKSDEGVLLGHFKAGETIVIQYVEGTWTLGVPPEKSGLPRLSPDEPLAPNATQRVKDHQFLYMAEIREKWSDGCASHTLPYNTRQKPYMHTVKQDCDVCLRTHDYYLADNDGLVTYRIMKQ